MVKNKWSKRPWGRFKVIEQDKNYKVKIIEINPKSRTSLQFHKFRSEFWYLLKGKVTFVIDNQEVDIRDIFGYWDMIKKKEVHRLQNNGKDVARILEVQEGRCKEDDIIRLEDDHGRI